MYEIVTTGALVVGGGGAASRAAIEASKFAQTAIAVDGVYGRAGTTTTGMGGMNVALGNFDSRDNWKVHYEDTIKGGQYLNNQELVEVFAKLYPAVDTQWLKLRPKNGDWNLCLVSLGKNASQLPFFARCGLVRLCKDLAERGHSVAFTAV